VSTKAKPVTRQPCADCRKAADDYSDHDRVHLCESCYVRRRHRDDVRRDMERRFLEALRIGDLPQAFRRAGFHRSDSSVESMNPDAWTTAREWDRATNLYIEGPPGVGKTFLARCVLLRYFAVGISVAAISARRLCKTADRFDEGRGDFARWCDLSLVALDDIDKIEPTARRVEALWEFFDRRESAEHRTILTANVPLGRLAEYLQPRDSANTSIVTATLDRLRPVRVLQLTGESRRGASVGDIATRVTDALKGEQG